LTVDEEGGVWVALYGGGAVRRYTPEGMLDEVIEVPAKQFTACTFGSSDLDELFITTSREGLEPGKDPLAGSLFRCAVGVAGRRFRSSPDERFILLRKPSIRPLDPRVGMRTGFPQSGTFTHAYFLYRHHLGSVFSR
jgi:hypothetical protein